MELNTNGVGFICLLTIVFITFKLTNVIDWSWWWILSPLWIGVSIVIIGGIFVYFWIKG